MIRAFVVTLITFAYVLMLGPPVILYALLFENSDPLYAVGRLGAKMALWLAGTRLEVQGLEKIPRGRAVVYMANHQGNCDPPALLAALPPILVMVKKEFFRVPILGRGMLARGFIPVDRKNREQAAVAIEQAVEKLKAGHSFLVFPEGTRSPDGRLQPFKKGVFLMALNARVPIVPISISGSSKIMPKGKFAIRPGPVRITVHGPVPIEGYTLDDRDRLIDHVHRIVRSGLAPEEWPHDEKGKSSAGPAVPHATASA